jgi:large subunit ribosomal protein L2
MIKLSNYCIAILGKMSNDLHFVTRIHNAGKNRKLGFRPTVRGVSKNPVDHPHGVEKEQDLLQKRIKLLMGN